MVGPRYGVDYEPSFYRSLNRIGLTWDNFDALAKRPVDMFLGTDPYEAKSTRALSGTEHRCLLTKDRFPDLPELLIAYRVDDRELRVWVTGAEPAWGEDALQRP